MKRATQFTLGVSALALCACSPVIEADVLLTNGTVFIGDGSAGQALNVGIKDDKIIYVSTKSKGVQAETVIDMNGLYVLPGFIDPHTHSLKELTSENVELRENRNYQFQAVTTVVNGNDGFGKPDVAAQRYCQVKFR